MEGAAFLYSCINEQIPCAQLRAVSNYVERRNKANWKMDLALENLTHCFIDILSEITENA
jgi:futalosine hydrolase